MGTSTLGRASKRVPELVSLSVTLIACVTLVGFATGIQGLTSVIPTLPSMRPNIAFALMLASASLWLSARSRLSRTGGKIGGACALAIAVYGFVCLCTYLLSVRSNWWANQPKLVEALVRVPVTTALSFLLIGIALLTLHFETARGSRPSQLLALTVAMIGLLTLLSYGYGIAALYQLNTGMAVNTSVAVILLSLGILSAYPNRGLMAVATSHSAGGFMLRRLMLAVIGVPPILGWLNVAGIDARLYSKEFGVALLVAANVVLFLIVIWRNAHLLHLMDAQRQQAVEALRRSNDVLESRVANRTSALSEANDALRGEVNERRRVAEELRRSQDDLTDLFENATVGLHWIGPDGTIIKANRAQLHMLGYERDEYVGHNIAEFHADQGAIEGILRLLSEGETLVDFPSRMRAKDGSMRDVLINSNVYFEGDRFIHTRCFTSDITEAKRIERERNQVEEERNQLLVREQSARSEAEQAAATVWRLQRVTDSALSHLALDELLHEILGRLQDLLGADAAAILLVTEDGKYLTGRAAIGLEEEARVRVPIGSGIAGRIASSRAPLVVDDLSKVEVVSSILSSYASSLVGAPLIIDDRVVGVLHVDTLEPHEFTAEDVNLLQLAADRVALAIDHSRLYEAEQKARVVAENTNRMKDEFLATISHELRSPLNSILGWVTLLREGSLNQDATTKALETIERSARAQNRIIGDLLDVSRIINGQLLLNVRTLNPAPIIEAGVEAVRPAAEAKGINLQKSLDRNVGPIVGDSDRLQQIVWNLVSNAIKFTPTGGIVDVRLEQVDSSVVVTVSDTGAGISPRFLPLVFDRFRQADSSSTRKQGGLGLGLAIVRHLVELHGGTVHAESEGLGKGATFIVELPMRGKPAESDGGGLAKRTTAIDDMKLDEVKLDCPLSLEGLHILVVDDEAADRDLVTKILVKCEVDVKTAASVEEALEILRDGTHWRPDVLISDIEMPEEDGYELMRYVRKMPPEFGGRVPAVALTAHARVEDRMKALAAGFQTHVPKPVEPAELLTVLASVTGRLARSTGPLSPC